MEATTSEGPSPGSLLPKACENCRIRKIRCNRQLPCSNCETSGISCRPAAKTTEHRSRVLVSANYEKQIEQINNRLSGIEDALKHIRLDKSSLSPNAVLDSTAASNATSDATRSHIATPAAFEGASSFTSQAIRASQAAERSLEKIGGSADVIDALSSLRNLVKTPGPANIRQEFRLGFAGTPRQLPEIPLLPAQFVLSLLQEFRVRHCAIFLAYAFRDQRELERICQRVYFPTEPVPLAVLTLMNGMLFYMIKEMVFDQSYGACREYASEMKEFCDQVEKNFHLGIETFDLLASPSLDSAKALMIATMKAQEEGKPLLCWTLVSAGARQVLTLGYHRKASMRNDPLELAEEKRQVFWSMYTVDKNLALTLGYSPTIQDYDIDVELFRLSPDPGVAAWDKAAIATIELSRLQGLIYERLYSLEALNATAEAKAQNVYDLSHRLERWYAEFSPIKDEPAHLPKFFFLIYGAFDVVYYSLLTTTHRAASPSSNSVEITSACYEAARTSLQKHLEFFPHFTSYGNDPDILTSYVSWVLLYASWTPLIVVFLHAIASSSKEDVALLQQTGESLEPLKNLTQQSEQVYGLSKIFCKLATAFVERNKTFVGTYNSQEDTVVMPQLDNFGQNQSFVPAPAGLQYSHQGMSHDLISGLEASEMEGMSMFLGNWLGGNQPVANLWNMDFSENMG